MLQKIINIFKLGALFSFSALLMTIAIISVLVTFKEKVALWFAKKIYTPGVLFILGVKIDLKGSEKVDFSTPNVFVSNHQSFIDIIIMIAISECNLYFIAKDELRKVPFLGWYVQAVGMIFLKRGAGKAAKQSLEKAGELIRKGKSVVLFPEGTRSKDGSIGKFKKGAFYVALEAGVKIVPVAMSGGGIVLPSKFMKTQPGTIRVRVGNPISLENYNRANLNELMSLTETTVKDLQCI